MECKSERLDDIPLIIEFCKRLNVNTLINAHLGNHGNQNDLSSGDIVLSWIAHILTTGDHCKAYVQEWANTHSLVLQSILNCPVSQTAFDDCRLGRLLERFADDEKWNDLEKYFYKDSFSILQLDVSPPESLTGGAQGISRTVKVDSTTTYGYHEVCEGKLMQYGFSKDHRPDLPQIKMMVSVEGNTGYQIASNIVAGNKNDDPLYIPVIERTRLTIETKNCLFCGDSKMSSISTRANIQKNGEFYLSPMHLNSKEKIYKEEMVERIVNGNQEAQLIYDISENGEEPTLIGAGFEVTRDQVYVEAEGNKETKWVERVFLIRSNEHVENEVKRFFKNIDKAKICLAELKSSLCLTEDKARQELLKKIEGLDCVDLFNFEVECSVVEKTHKRAEKRNGEVRNGHYTTRKYRAKTINISIDSDKISEIKRKIGWRLYVTNAPSSYVSFQNAYRYYRKTMCVIEVGFHVIKEYCQISPLFVRAENQIIGMTRLLMFALKILTLMTAEIRSNMKKGNVVLKGLYAGQQAREHKAPTAQSILQYFSRQNLVVAAFKIGEEWQWSGTPLSDTCRSILKLLKLPEESYTALPERLKGLGCVL